MALGLCFAMRGNQKHIIEYMLATGARIDPVHADRQDCSAFPFAASGGLTEAISPTLNFEAKVSAVDINGWTPLHLACRNGSNVAVQLLIDSGTMLQSKDKQGLTPLDVATICGNDFLCSIFGQSENKSLDADGKQKILAPGLVHQAFCDNCIHVSPASSLDNNTHELTKGLGNLRNSLQMR